MTAKHMSVTVDILASHMSVTFLLEGPEIRRFTRSEEWAREQQQLENSLPGFCALVGTSTRDLVSMTVILPMKVLTRNFTPLEFGDALLQGLGGWTEYERSSAPQTAKFRLSA